MPLPSWRQGDFSGLLPSTIVKDPFANAAPFPNNVIPGMRHVTVAWGRDYGDVPPVKGVIWTEAKKSTLAVSVDVAPVG